MNFRNIALILGIATLCSVEGHRYGYRKYKRYGKKHISLPVQDEQPIIPKVPVNPSVNICPQIVCPLIYIPQECVKETFTNVYGVICKGCDQNVCKKNVVHSEGSKLNIGPARGDIPEVPKFLDKLNGGNNVQWIDTTSNQNPVIFPDTQWRDNIQTSNGVQWHNNVPVWQNNVPINTQWQNNVPRNAEWQDNTPINTQWQNTISVNNQWQNNVPVNTQWQNSVPVNNQWQNTIPVNTQWQNTPHFPLNNQWQSGPVSKQQMKPVTFLGNMVQSIPSAKEIPANQWESGPLQAPVLNNQWQNVQKISKIPSESSLPIFKKDGNIGSPISGLPIQITGKSSDPAAVRVESDQNLGFTNPLYDEITFGNSPKTLSSQVYDANSPGGLNNVVGGKK